MSDKLQDLPIVVSSANRAKQNVFGRALTVLNGVRLAMMHGYDGGDRMRFGRWGGPRENWGPDRQLVYYERDKNRVRQQVVENPIARRSRNVKVSNWIGDQGFIPRLDPFPEINKRWLAWSESKECDANSRHTFLGLQKQLGNAIATDGEILSRFRDRDPNSVFDRALTKNSGVGVQVQLMEIDHLVLGRNRIEENGTVTIEGENRSQYNNGVLGYYLYRRNPLALVVVPMNGPNLPVWYPAADVLRISHVDRIGATRSAPPLKTILPTLKDRYDYLDAEIVRKGVAARRTYVIKMPGMPDDKDVLKSIMGMRAEGADIEAEGKTASGEYVVSMPDTGESISLPPGWDMAALDPADVGEGFLPFNQVVGQEIAAGTDQAYVNVTMDTNGINDRMARWVDIQVERDIGFDQEEYFIRQFVRPVWQRWLTRAFFVDNVFDLNDYGGIEGFAALMRINFSYPKRAYVNRYQEAQADDMRLKNGSTSRTRIQEAEGEDPSQIALERAMEAAVDRALQPGSTFAKQVDAKALERLTSMLRELS
jgi:lambda family phage portal protein